MKIKLLVAAYCFFAGVTTTPAQVSRFKVTVPFEFQVAKQTFPAGEYLIWSVRNQLFLRVAGGNTLAMIQCNHTVHDGGKNGKVLFNCYEKRCFLSQLWTPDPEQAREIPKSKFEMELARRGEAQQFALLGKLNQ